MGFCKRQGASDLYNELHQQSHLFTGWKNPLSPPAPYAPALWNVADGRVINSFMKRPLPLRPYSVVSPDGRYILTNSDNMHRPSSLMRQQEKSLKYLTATRRPPRFLTDGRHLLLVGNMDQKVLWNLTTDKPAKTYRALRWDVRKTAGMPRASSRSGEVKVWDADADREILSYTEHAGDIEPHLSFRG
ncbi:MAG: WD40 repeat domain-containing protein [Desulfobacterales bacterium]|nr:WD40 repeat domain-containing protein [Desulfobacterales bacterium]